MHSRRNGLMMQAWKLCYYGHDLCHWVRTRPRFGMRKVMRKKERRNCVQRCSKFCWALGSINIHVSYLHSP